MPKLRKTKETERQKKIRTAKIMYDEGYTYKEIGENFSKSPVWAWKAVNEVKGNLSPDKSRKMY